VIRSGWNKGAMGKQGRLETRRPLTARDVADRCGVELKTVHNWVERGLLEHFRTPGRHLRFQTEHVRAFLDKYAKSGPAARVEVLVVGRRPRGVRSAWLIVSDAYEALVRAGLDRPMAVVIDGAGVERIDGARYVRALRRGLPATRVVWVGANAPRDRNPVECVRHMREVEAALSSKRT
jgi:excisionase family DNA binding protein